MGARMPLVSDLVVLGWCGKVVVGGGGGDLQFDMLSWSGLFKYWIVG